MKLSCSLTHNSISLEVREVCQDIQADNMDELIDYLTKPRELQDIADQVYTKWNVPNTLGAIDRKHITIKCPPNTGSTCHNYKSFFSVLLFAMVDAYYNFLCQWRGICLRCPGVNHRELLGAIDTIDFPDNAPTIGPSLCWETLHELSGQT